MESARLMARALVDPLEGVSAAVAARRWAVPLSLLVVAASVSGAAFAARWDAAPQVVRDLAASGELARSSEREVQEVVERAERVRLVTGVARGVFLVPLLVLLVAVVLKLCGWLLDAPAPFAACLTAASIAGVPIALFHLAFAAAALRQPALSEAQAQVLLPSSLLALAPRAAAKLARVLSAVDFFNLWAVLLLGLGFSQAAGVRRVGGVVLAFTLYVAFAGAFLIGLPGLTGGAR